MKIHAQQLESFGVLICQEIEPNTPNIPEIDEVEVAMYLFDGEGVFEHNGKHYYAHYPLLQDCIDDSQIRSYINNYRFGGRLADEDPITIDDLCICYGEFEECTEKEFAKYFFENLEKALSKAEITPDSIKRFNHIKKGVLENPPKNLYVFKDVQTFLEALDGKVYATYDCDGIELCDVLEEDLISLEEQNVLHDPYGENDLNDMRLTSPDKRDFLESQRVEIIILNRN